MIYYAAAKDRDDESKGVVGIEIGSTATLLRHSYKNFNVTKPCGLIFCDGGFNSYV